MLVEESPVQDLTGPMTRTQSHPSPIVLHLIALIILAIVLHFVTKDHEPEVTIETKPETNIKKKPGDIF